MKLQTKPLESTDAISELKKQFFQSSTAPLDGMWHFGFAQYAKHYGFYKDDILVGYCCINDDGYILQFYLTPPAQSNASELFTLIAHNNNPVLGKVKGAFCSTAETNCFLYCLDNSPSIEVNSLMYQQIDASKIPENETLDMTLATQNQLDDFVKFAVESIGAPEQWLSGYFSGLIERNELWGYWINNILVASGECRLRDEHQTEYADLGMIVAPSERGKGIATRILKTLKNKTIDKGLKPICSTEHNNIGAQKAIRNAGFESSNRIVQFNFK